jgi:hypothetical protein
MFGVVLPRLGTVIGAGGPGFGLTLLWLGTVMGGGGPTVGVVVPWLGTVIGDGGTIDCCCDRISSGGTRKRSSLPGGTRS